MGSVGRFGYVFETEGEKGGQSVPQTVPPYFLMVGRIRRVSGGIYAVNHGLSSSDSEKSF